MLWCKAIYVLVWDAIISIYVRSWMYIMYLFL